MPRAKRSVLVPYGRHPVVSRPWWIASGSVVPDKTTVKKEGIEYVLCIVGREGLSTYTSNTCHATIRTIQYARKAVNEVWESCFNDTRPFDEVSESLYALRLHN